MPSALLARTLKRNLRDAGRVAVLGIGSELRGDDAAGILVVQALEPILAQSECRTMRTFVGGSAPENMTGEIRRFVRHENTAGGHVVLVDAAHMDEKPGTVRIVASEDLAGVSFSTHQLPLTVLVDYLRQSVGVVVTIIAIQPKSVSMGAPVCRAVTQAVARVVSALRRAISRSTR